MASTTIAYFSGTGNALAVSRNIAAKLGETTIVSMSDDNSVHALENAERVGFVFPVYVFGQPLIVTRFMQKVRVRSDAYVFAVAVHGGMPFGTLKQASALLGQHGIKLSAGYEVTMVDNYIPLAGAIPPNKQQIRFEKANRKIDKVCASITKGERFVYPGWPVLNWLFSRMYYGWAKNAPAFDKKFFTESNCDGCGVCEKVCPVNNIAIDNRHVAWQHHCEQCLACLQWCPQKAIQYGKRTAGRARYHHPEIKLKDMLHQKSSTRV